MSRILAAFCAALTAFFSVPALPESPPGPAAAEYRCLAAGMDWFVNEPSTAPCSANNTELMAALLYDCLPEGTRITRRVNGPGTAAGMEQLIRDAFRGAGEEDVSILYLSTHGVAWEEEGGERRCVLVLSDGTAEEALELRTLRRMMDRVPGKKVLILDCCHAGAAAETFRGPEWRVLAGCGPEEDCYFWAAEEVTGMGYFTSALENALRTSRREEIDPDGNGAVSLRELARRMREIYGVSHAVFLPEEDEDPLFRLPEERMESERIQDLRFDPVTETDGQIELSFHFRTETAVRMEYRLVPMGEGSWDFAGAARLPDQERIGQKRGFLSAGEKNRTIRVSREKLGESGRALLQIVSFRGLYGQVPVPECTVVIGENGEP